MMTPKAYYRPDDMFVTVVLLDPPYAYGRMALCDHPLLGRVRLPLSQLEPS